MEILFGSWALQLCAVLITLCLGIYTFFIIQYQYWKKRGIPYEEPSFPFGNITDVAMRRIPLGIRMKQLYQKFDGCKLAGTYQLYRPALMIRDPEEIKRFLVKDFAHFHDRGLYADEKREPLTAHLFTMEGTKWRNLRAKLTPTFTSGKMKMMFPTIAKCGKDLEVHLATAAHNNETIEVKDILAKFSTDIIANCAFGIQSNSLKNPDSEFRTMGRKIFQFSFLTSVRFLLGAFAPTLAALTRLPLIPADVSNFFRGVVKETIEYRENNNVTRNDFMQLLIQLKNNKSITDAEDNGNSAVGDTRQTDKDGGGRPVMEESTGLTMDQAAAQAFVFFVAGFETSSTTMSFCLYELALHHKIQDRLREEIDQVTAKHGGLLTYEGIQEMEYLDRVVAETLRKYPPAPIILRKCTKAYKLAGTDVTIDVGTTVLVPLLGLHYDPRYYPEPDQFDPERFTTEMKNKRPHYTYLPFGEGPRICIGSRFALMQTKVGIASVISSYQFNVCTKSTAVPLVMDAKTFITTAAGGINLQVAGRRRSSS